MYALRRLYDLASRDILMDSSVTIDIVIEIHDHAPIMVLIFILTISRTICFTTTLRAVQIDYAVSTTISELGFKYAFSVATKQGSQ
jgi:hypothetical protein